MYRLLKVMLALMTTAIGLVSCTTVKAYQKQYVHDYHLQPGALSHEKLEAEGISFREGASGGESGKTGGGCGCN